MKIALITNDDHGMWQFRGGLIQALIARNIEVYVLVPPGPFVEKLQALGAIYIPIQMYRFISPLQDLRLMWQFYRIFISQKFDLIHTMTIKPNLFATFAAKLAGVPRIVSLVSGIGFIFASESKLLVSICIRPLVMLLYRWALSISNKTWFQNQDDFDFFSRKKLIIPTKGIVIRGSGVNLTEFSRETVDPQALKALRLEIQLSPSEQCVMMISSRLIWSKGVREFIEAVEMLAPRFERWKFVILCPKDPDAPDAVPEAYTEAHRSDRLQIIDEMRLDVKNFLELADILVLVSYYREGVPRILLEGLAMEKPIVTSNSVGCKEVVEDGKNGYLVPIKNASVLAEKLEKLMQNQAQRSQFGKFSRRMAIDFFDEKIVIHRVITELYGIRA
ncbi:hypothetical protein DO97_09170 [Neosynechococcus sphagnicola sy1]|uniref:Glycosyl transferase family 1 n=1 Tax=Neosynechococcus sphagnicola sy1 TaxID=1497020 RepID=A0A098TNF5_9CYAN|nr:glycosyltransferase family 4 protein [Neosynechococcus sphagnicola]KGF72373.1 hypothetical protein DO97_09170 [Neosynechococcus sphagnicola sy1]